MDFMTFCERVGFPIAVVTALGLGMYKALLWIGENVVKPIAASHVALVESTKKSNESNSETLRAIADILQLKVGKLDSVEANSIKILDLTVKNHELLTTRAPGA